MPPGSSAWNPHYRVRPTRPQRGTRPGGKVKSRRPVSSITGSHLRSVGDKVKRRQPQARYVTRLVIDHDGRRQDSLNGVGLFGT